MNNLRVGPGVALVAFALASFLLFPIDAHAAVSNENMLDGIVEKINSITVGMASQIVGFASKLFWTLVVISMVWTFGMMALRKADIGEFFAELVRFTIFTGFFWWLLTNAVTGMNIAGTIIESMRNMAAQATGLGRELSPSGIVIKVILLAPIGNIEFNIPDGIEISIEFPLQFISGFRLCHFTCS